MKNVQYYLKKVNKKELAKSYFDKYVFARILNDRYKKYRNLSFNEYYKKAMKKIVEYINKLCKLKTLNISDDEQLIIICYEQFRDEKYFDVAGYHYKDVFSRKKDIEGYSYIFEHQDTIMSYYIADTYYNKKNMKEILIDIKHDDKVDKITNEMSKEEKKEKYKNGKGFRKELGYTNKEINLMNEYDKRRSNCGIEELGNQLIKFENKCYKRSLMFQVNEIRNNNLCLLDKA